MRIAVIIPALNEEITIAKVVKDFRKELPESRIFVMDNGSTDKTAEEAKSAGAEVAAVPRRGKGRAMQYAFDNIEADYYVIVDGDDTYEAKDVHKLMEPVVKHQADMSVGNRMEHFTKEEKKIIHSLGNRMILIALKFCFPAKIKDMLSGYRVMSRDAVKSLSLISSGFAIETELTIKAFEECLSVIEIPIEYRKRPEGSKSKLDTFSDGMYITTTIISLFRDYRPMQFFMLFSILPFSLAAGFGYGVVLEYARTGAISQYGSLLMSVMFIMLTFMLLMMGFLASSVHASTREMMHLLKKVKR